MYRNKDDDTKPERQKRLSDSIPATEAPPFNTLLLSNMRKCMETGGVIIVCLLGSPSPAIAKYKELGTDGK